MQFEIPEDVRAELGRWVGRRQISESAWIEEAVREKLAACAQVEYLEGRAARGSREEYDRVLAKVPASTPLAGDER
ncbi:MAG: hypothetical protein U0746_09130 [Gemmataceae bacterium]